jgi:phosphonate transport system substrate-binding protein
MPVRLIVFRLALASVLSIAFAGCGRPDDADAAPLRIAFVPQVDMEERHQAAYRALHDYLSPRLGRRVEIVQLENANAALEGLRSGKLDVCNFSPWPYLLAEKKAGLEALLLTQAPDGNPVHYRGILVTHPGTGLSVPTDIKERAGELVFAFEEPVSTSGHLVPRTFLHEAGINPEKDFKRVLYGSDGIANLFAVASRRIDLAALSDSSLRRAYAKGRIREGEVIVVWSSAPVLSNVTAARAALPAGVKRQLSQLLMEMPRISPDHWAEVAKQYSNPVVGYMPVQAGSLDFFRNAIRDVPGLQFGP